MRLNLFDVNVFQPRDEAAAQPVDANIRDLSGTADGSYDRADGPVWENDRPAVVRSFGFGPSTRS